MQTFLNVSKSELASDNVADTYVHQVIMHPNRPGLDYLSSHQSETSRAHAWEKSLGGRRRNDILRSESVRTLQLVFSYSMTKGICTEHAVV